MATRRQVFKRMEQMMEALDDGTTAYSGHEAEVDRLREGMLDLIDRLAHSNIKSLKLREWDTSYVYDEDEPEDA